MTAEDRAPPASIPIPRDDAPTHCRSSFKDGECYWKYCPQRIPGNYKSLCPLLTEEQLEDPYQ